MAAVTLQDVARRAGVSLATASRVLNGSARTPRPDVAERVREAAADLGYVANAQAQALARASTRLIGLVVHDIADPYFSSIAGGVQRVARRHGRQVLLASTGRDPAAEHEAVQAFAAHRTDAIVVAGSRRDSGTDAAVTAELERFRRNGGRVAVIGQAFAGAGTVVPENRAGAAALAEALVDRGHRRFAVLTGPDALRTARDRADGFIEQLGKHGLEPVAVAPGGFDRDGGFTAAQGLVGDLDLSPGHSGSRSQPWTEAQSGARTGARSEALCVFAVNDVMAIGAIAAFRDAGLRVPDHVQVAGFDDIPTLRDFVPALTTVRLPLAHMGERAVELALADDSPGPVSVPGDVVLRDSTRLG